MTKRTHVSIQMTEISTLEPGSDPAFQNPTGVIFQINTDPPLDLHKHYFHGHHRRTFGSGNGFTVQQVAHMRSSAGEVLTRLGENHSQRWFAVFKADR